VVPANPDLIDTLGVVLSSIFTTSRVLRCVRVLDALVP
jgi:hypothetical protein